VVLNTGKKARTVTAIVNRESSATSKTWDSLAYSATGFAIGVDFRQHHCGALVQRERGGHRHVDVRASSVRLRCCKVARAIAIAQD
jgi:hypothetical protein